MSFLRGSELLRQVQEGRLLLADGAVGSELIDAGIAPNRTVAANCTHPQTVRTLHRRAITAGADIITSNTFGNPAGEGWEEALRGGIALALAAAQEAERPIAVLLSVYPDTLLQTPSVLMALTDRPEARDCVLLIETAVSLQAVVEAVECAQSAGIGPIAATCHFQRGGSMPDGTTPAQAAAALHKAGAAIVGGNCGDVPQEMPAVAQKMRAATDLPLLFQPNAGLPALEGDRWAYPTSTELFAEIGRQLFSSGASIVGGCCGTTPAHIAALRRFLLHPQ